GLEAVFFGRDFCAYEPGLMRRNYDDIAMCNGRDDVPGKGCLDRNSPPKLAIRRAQTDQAVCDEADQLIASGEFQDGGRRIGGLVVLGFPDRFARALVEANAARPILPARAGVKPLAHDDRASVIAVAAGSGRIPFLA